MTIFRKALFFLTFFSIFLSYSQSKEINFIVSVNNSLRNVYAEKLLIKKVDGTTKTINLDYVQGNLSIKDNDFQDLASGDVSNIQLMIRYFKNCGDETENISYNIEEFKLDWLTKGTFFSLYIYDTESKKYTKLYDPLPGKKFTFEYDWSEGSMRRVQKKLTKRQKKCNN